MSAEIDRPARGPLDPRRERKLSVRQYRSTRIIKLVTLRRRVAEPILPVRNKGDIRSGEQTLAVDAAGNAVDVMVTDMHHCGADPCV